MIQTTVTIDCACINSAVAAPESSKRKTTRSLDAFGSLLLTAIVFCSITTATAQPTSNPAAAATPATPSERRLSAANAMRMHDHEKIKLDGSLDESLWQRAVPITNFYEYRPRDGVEAKFRSEARIVYDKNALYIGLTAFDPDPSKINAPFVRRDQVNGSQDFFAIEIDPLGTRKFAQIFRVSASGSVGDGLFNEDSGDEDFSPDFEWTSQVQRTANGWTAEIRIPFSTLRYSSPASENWSILIIRRIARDEVYSFINGRVPRDQSCFLCYAQTLGGMKDLPSGRELTVTPQLTVRSGKDVTTNRTSSEASNSNGNGRNGRKNDFIVSADIKFRPRADMVFDATINPDFSQVELDAPQLASNAQFALFFPEKRPFFLEGADILSTPFGGAIYTRSITDPAWGARLTKRDSGTDFILLTARDDGKGLIFLPGALNTNFATQDTKSQVTIARGRMDLGKWSIGGLLSDRTYETTADKKPLYNRVGGVDFVLRPNGESRVRGQILLSATHDERNQGSIALGTPRNDEAALLDYYINGPKWNFSGGVEQVGKGFRNDNGFFSQAGYINIYQNLNYKIRDIGPFIEIQPQLNAGRKEDVDGRLLEQQANPSLYLSLPRNTSMYLSLRTNNLVRFQPSGAPLKLDQFYINIDSNPGRVLTNFFAELLVGDRGDVANNRVGKGYSYAISGIVRLSNRWEIESRIDNAVINSIEPVAFGSNRILLERAVQLKSVYHFTARDTLRFIGQHNSTRRAPSAFKASVSSFDKNEIASIVYSHRRGLGTNFYVGFTQSRTVNPDSVYKRKQNELFVKWSWAFDLAELI